MESSDRPLCAADDCNNPANPKMRGLCRRHYVYDLNAGRTCSVAGCPRTAWARNLCSAHYYRWHKHGDPGEAELRRKPTRPCIVKDCKNTAKTSADLCPTHARRKRLYGNEDGTFSTHIKCEHCSEPAVAGPRSSSLCRGHYIAEVKRLVVAGEIQGRRSAAGYVYHNVFKVRYAEHRIVMEAILGRPLLSSEEPHHLNGVRWDNRPENLELWSDAQPSGQRVTDKVAWAVELLQLYAPELLAGKPVQLRLIT